MCFAHRFSTGLIPPVPLLFSFPLVLFSPQSPRSGSLPLFSRGQFSEGRAAADNKMGLSELRPVVRDSDWMYWDVNGQNVLFLRVFDVLLNGFVLYCCVYTGRPIQIFFH